jgi:hypothetical protein
VDEQVVEPMMLKPYYRQAIVPMKKVMIVALFLVIHPFLQYMIELNEEILLDQIDLVNELIHVVILAMWQMNDAERKVEQNVVVVSVLWVDLVVIENDVRVI